jgi:hypothetical protein
MRCCLQFTLRSNKTPIYFTVLVKVCPLCRTSGSWLNRFRFVFPGENYYIGLLLIDHQTFRLAPFVCHRQGVVHQVPEGCKKVSTSYNGYVICMAINVKTSL